MVIKWGRNGEFLGCSNYPNAPTRGVRPRRSGQHCIRRNRPRPPSPTSICEKCGKPMVRRRSRFGEFLGCSGYPDCDGIKRCRPSRSIPGVNCPDCKEGEVLERRSRRGKVFFGCGRYPKCKFASWDKRRRRSPARIAARPIWSRRSTKRDGTRWQCPKQENAATRRPRPSRRATRRSTSTCAIVPSPEHDAFPTRGRRRGPAGYRRPCRRQSAHSGAQQSH